MKKTIYTLAVASIFALAWIAFKNNGQFSADQEISASDVKNLKNITDKVSVTTPNHDDQTGVSSQQSVDKKNNIIKSTANAFDDVITNSIEDLGYDELKLVQLECEGFYVQSTGDGFTQSNELNWLEYSRIYDGPFTKKQLKFEKHRYDRCTSIAVIWDDINHKINDLGDAKESDLFVALNLEKISEEEGAGFAREIAIDIFNQTNTPMAMIYAHYFLFEDVDFNRPYISFFQEKLGHISPVAQEQLLGHLMMYRFCQMGGDCGPYDSHSFFGGCYLNHHLCGNDVIANMQYASLPPQHFEAVISAYQTFF